MREPLFSVSGALFGTSLRKNPNNDNNERNFNQPFQRLLGYTSAGQHVTGNRKPYPQRCTGARPYRETPLLQS